MVYMIWASAKTQPWNVIEKSNEVEGGTDDKKTDGDEDEQVKQDLKQ